MAQGKDSIEQELGKNLNKEYVKQEIAAKVSTHTYD